MSDANVTVRATAKPAVRQFPPPDASRLTLRRPMGLASFIPNPSMIFEGNPVVPRIWVRGKGVASTSGEFVNADRPSPRETDVPCHTRFLGGDDLWDDVAGVWRPYFTSGIDYYWQSSPANKPVATEIEYRLGREIVELDAISFTSGDYLSSSFNQGMDDAVEFTVVLVASFVPPTGFTVMQASQRNLTVGESFILTAPGVPNQSRLELKSLAHPSQMSPTVIVMSVKPPWTYVYVTSPDKKRYSGAVASTSDLTTDMNFILGGNGTVNLANMAVVEFALFDYAVLKTQPPGLDRLNADQVIALYAQMYGA